MAPCQAVDAAQATVAESVYIFPCMESGSLLDLEWEQVPMSDRRHSMELWKWMLGVYFHSPLGEGVELERSSTFFSGNAGPKFPR